MGYSRRGPAATGQCSAMVYEGNWPGNCTRPAVEDGLCRPHLTGKRRRDARYSQEEARYRAERAQAAFVAQWREMYPELVWSEAWTCPLCAMTIQVNAPQNNKRAGDLRELRIREHQQWHGKEWDAYLAAAATGAEGE